MSLKSLKAQLKNTPYEVLPPTPSSTDPEAHVHWASTDWALVSLRQGFAPWMGTAGLEHIGHGTWRYTLSSGAKVVDTEDSLFLERVDIEKALRIYLKELATTSQMQAVGPMIAPIVQVGGRVGGWVVDPHRQAKVALPYHDSTMTVP